MLRMKYSNGFSLLEVLVAFIITALVVSVIYQVYAKGLTAALLGQEYTTAVTIAESKLALVGHSMKMDVSEYQGLEHDKFHWILKIEDYDGDGQSQFASSLQLRAVHIKVSWESKGKSHHIQLDSLRPVIESW